MTILIAIMMIGRGSGSGTSSRHTCELAVHRDGLGEAAIMIGMVLFTFEFKSVFKLNPETPHVTRRWECTPFIPGPLWTLTGSQLTLSRHYWVVI